MLLTSRFIPSLALILSIALGSVPGLAATKQSDMSTQGAVAGSSGQSAGKALTRQAPSAPSSPDALVPIDKRITLTRDGDYFGFDLKTIKDTTLDGCSQACLKESQCKAFTYNPKAKWCFLKTDSSQLKMVPGSIAGKIADSAQTEDLGEAPRLPFLTQDQRVQAADMKAHLTYNDDQAAQGIEAVLADARKEREAGNAENAVALYEAALAFDPENVALWLERAKGDKRIADNNEAALQSAYAALNAYELSRTHADRADALATLATALEKAGEFRRSLSAYKESLKLVDSKTVRAAYLDLRNREGFRVLEHTVDSDAADPRACIQFSEPLVKTGVDYANFVTLDGKVAPAMEAKGNQICVDGLAHGQRYKIELRQGLPSSVDEDLQSTVSLDIYVRDRAALVHFSGENFVLPSHQRRGIPLISINTRTVNLKLYRIGDRNLAQTMTSSQFLTQLDGYAQSQLADQNGSLVWTGAIDVKSDLNKEVVSSIPIDQALPERKPGVYVMTAIAAEGKQQNWDPKATQWFVISDIGLSTYSGEDGLTVFARSLATAKPVAGLDISLLAKNNEVLGTLTSDETGKVRFDAGLSRGGAANAPAVLTAKSKDGDFVFLDMTKAGFDLSDRGVTGRAPPGAVDVFAWTERGIYRAGETVHAAALSRDSAGNSVDRLPLTFIFTRPDGVEDRRLIANGAETGGHFADLALQPTAMLGTWKVSVYTDPKGTALAEKTFLVDEFVPDRTEFDMVPDQAMIDPAKGAVLAISGRYLYGAPAAGLTLEGDLKIKPVRSLDSQPGFLFGLADEEDFQAKQVSLSDLPALDENGKASVNLMTGDLPTSSKLMAADVSIRMREAGGRAVERRLTLPVQPNGPMIGIKTAFGDAAAENSNASLQVIAIDATTARAALAGAKWSLVKIERNYQWYKDDNSWRFEPVDSTTKVASGSLDIAKEGSTLSVPVTYGRYRLELTTSASRGPASSIEFDAGWYVAAKSTETPDGLEIGLDKPRYAVGDTAVLKVSPRYAGHVQVIAGSDHILSISEGDIAAGGGEVKIPVTADWGSGTYLTAVLYRPGDQVESRLPMRAIGVKWASVDPKDAKLQVKLDLPQKILPHTSLTIPVTVSNAGAGDEAYVTVAAVDVGILNLTRYEVPDPEGWYFGQRRLGFEIRDLYGRLIDGSLGETGALRTGGDGGDAPLNGNPPTEKLVAFFSGPVKLDASGKAVVSFDIPQFNGTARVMAVAWSRKGIGHVSGDVIIRDPVVITPSLPRFMATGDDSRLRLDFANNDAPAGAYHLKVKPTSGLSIGKDTANVDLNQGGKAALTLSLKALSAGQQQIAIQLSDDKGFQIAQTIDLLVREPSLPQYVRRTVSLAPGQSLTVDKQLLAASRLSDASLTIALTRSPEFDIQALLMTLDRYPYGCAEQTTSRAMPLLYAAELDKAAGLAEDKAVAGRIEDAIRRVLSYQATNGAFGLWSPGSGDMWLDAYVTDFLTRAREQKWSVPDEAMVSALNNLQNLVNYNQDVKVNGNEIAYALYVLARNKKAAISDLRYFADVKRDEFPTPLARAQLAAALALYGDAARAKSMFENAAAFGKDGPEDFNRSDYGTKLRDDAAMLSLAAESVPKPSAYSAFLSRASRSLQAANGQSTQEQGWLLMAARSIKSADQDIRADINGKAVSGPASLNLTGQDIVGSPVTVTNRGTDPVSAVVTTLAAPVEALPAGGSGFTIERSYYTLTGEQVDVSTVRQNERYVVVLAINQQNDWPQKLMVTDLLPAGFEIDNPSLVTSAKLANFDWLPDVEVAHSEFRSDRFVAALNRPKGNAGDFSLAYVVRAVTPGTYVHPAAVVEDMYRPQFVARTATGMMKVDAAQ